MNQQQASAFLSAINLLQPYVPPILFKDIATCELARTLVGVANGQLSCEIKPQSRNEASKTKSEKK